VGSFDPPLRTTFFRGGQGFNPAAPAFAELAFAEPAFVDPTFVESAFVNPASAGFVASAGLPTAGFRAVGEFEQLEGMVFL
jgi:hypothetical protein